MSSFKAESHLNMSHGKFLYFIGWVSVHDSWEIKEVFQRWHWWMPARWKVSEKNPFNVLYTGRVKFQINDLAENMKTELTFCLKCCTFDLQMD